MPKPRVALFSDSGNTQTRAIAQAVLRQGGEPLELDLRVGSGASLSLAQDRLHWGGQDFSQVDVAHMVCTAASTPVCMPPLLNEATAAEFRAAYLREQQNQAFIQSFLEVFADRGGLVVNPLPGAFGDHDTKTQLYEKLRAWGLDVPKNLTTNDPARASEFLERVGKSVIKPAHGVGPTRMLNPPDPDFALDFCQCPVLMQEYVQGATLRSHIVGNTVICTFRVEGAGVDSRSGKRKIFPAALSEGFCRELVRVNRLMGLHYSAWDLIRTPEGKTYCLDCNPGPYVMWMGDDIAEKILDRLAAFMVAYGASHCLEEAARAVSPLS